MGGSVDAPLRRPRAASLGSVHPLQGHDSSASGESLLSPVILAHAKRVNLVRATAMQTKLGLTLGGAKLPDELADSNPSTEWDDDLTSSTHFTAAGGLASANGSWLKLLHNYRLMGSTANSSIGSSDAPKLRSREVRPRSPRGRARFLPPYGLIPHAEDPLTPFVLILF